MDVYRLREIILSGYRWRISHFGGPQPVVILGHMRSGSTLLSHILADHREIVGMGEQNFVYRRREDLDELAARVYSMTLSFRARHRYVVDQINHNRFTAEPDVLRGVAKVVLIRDPVQSVPSMLRAFSDSWYWDEEVATRYYRERIAFLGALIDSDDGGEAFVLTYDDLVDRGPAVVAELTSFLGLAEPLRAAYKQQLFTARRSDGSESIRSGVIRRAEYDDDPLDPATLAGAVAEYDRFVSRYRTTGG